MKTQEHLQVSAAREENPSWDVTALKAADESRFWREKAFGVRQNVNWELKPSRAREREQLLLLKFIHRQKHDFAPILSVVVSHKLFWRDFHLFFSYASSSTLHPRQ